MLILTLNYTPLAKGRGGYIGFTLSVRLSVRLSTMSHIWICYKFGNLSLCWLSLTVQGWVFMTQSTHTKLTRCCIFLLISRFWLSQIPGKIYTFLSYRRPSFLPAFRPSVFEIVPPSTFFVITNRIHFIFRYAGCPYGEGVSRLTFNSVAH